MCSWIARATANNFDYELYGDWNYEWTNEKDI